MIDLNGKRIIISRTDSIGDVMLTLPLCAWIKDNFQNTTVVFLGKSYTKPVVSCFKSVDEFIDWQEVEAQPKSIQLQTARDWNADVIIHVFPRKEIAVLAKKARIPVRVGTSHRNFHLLNCNERVNFTRKRSELHESQLNFHLMKPFGLKEIPSLEELSAYTRNFVAPKVDLPEELDQLDQYIILHPKSQGSAVEWPLEKYRELGDRLVELGYQVVITGTEKEGEMIRPLLMQKNNLIDATGKLDLYQLIAFISGSNALVACSTGPLHIAGFLNIRAVGLFAPRRPIHPGRWKPLGEKSTTLIFDENCETCKKGKACLCIQDIEIEQVVRALTH
ncbi:MAG: lipopolysaccharide heptosyltransferase family protein [Bacteroidetes bacterium]|nr:MAG: lipopolysaccharide heptosyltransferase family protein [Bacteroidota bacterium]